MFPQKKYTLYAISLPPYTHYVEKTEKGRRKDVERKGFFRYDKPLFYALYALSMLHKLHKNIV